MQLDSPVEVATTLAIMGAIAAGSYQVGKGTYTILDKTGNVLARLSKAAF